MKFNWKNYAVAALLAGGLCGRAQAAPLVDVSILGSDGSSSGPFSSTLNNVNAGDTIYYQVQVEMAPLNSTNGTHTITSLVAGGTDGVSAISFNLSDTGVSWNSDNVLAAVWTGTTGFSAGTVSQSSGIAGIFGLPASGSRQGVASTNTPGNVLVYSGSVVAGSGNSTITGADDGNTAGFSINGFTFHPSVTSGDSNGYFSFAPLQINASTGTPEPGTLGLLAITGVGFLARRRRRRMA